MIGTIYTLENEKGQSIKINDHSDKSKGIALQSYPQFSSQIKQNEVRTQGQHGVWDFYSFYDKMTINLSGVIYGDNQQEVERLKEDLNQVVSLPTQPFSGNSGKIMLKWEDDDGNKWQIETKLFGSIQYRRSMKLDFKLDFNLSLKAPTPFIVGQELIEVDGIRAKLTEGTSFPMSLPATLGSLTLNPMIVDNEGTVDAHTVIRIYGEASGVLTNPRIINQTTGAEFKIETTLNGIDKYFEIDSQYGTVVDESGEDKSGFISTDSQFITLNSGENQLAYFADESDRVPTASWRLSYRNTKI